MTFQQSYKRLEQIYELLQKDDITDIDQIIKLQEEANKLYDFCNQIMIKDKEEKTKKVKK